MNRYPLWKNLLVFGVIVVSTIIALPNLFGDDEAVQVSRTDGVAVDAPALEQVRMALTDRRCRVPVCRDRGDVGARAARDLATTESARDVLTKELPNHVVALTLSPRTPGWLKALGLEPMLLGLDLRGGVHFLYEVDLDSAVGQYLETYETDLRTQFREAQHPQRRPRRRHELAGRRSSSRPTWIAPRRSSARSIPAISCCSSASSRAGSSSTARRSTAARVSTCALTESAIRERQDFAIQQNTVTLRNRVNELGVAEAVVQRQGLDRILVELPGIQDPATAKRVLGSTATLEFHLVDTENDAFEAQRRGRAPLGSELHRAARRLADPAAARHHRVRRSARRRHAGVLRTASPS